MQILIYVSHSNLEYLVKYLEARDLEMNPPFYRITTGTGSWVSCIISYNDYVWLTDNTNPADI